MISSDTGDRIACGHFENVIANHCLMHKIENDFIHTPECYKQKVDFINIHK